jgi:tetratricopeptide (TPR) repeat protein
MKPILPALLFMLTSFASLAQDVSTPREQLKQMITQLQSNPGDDALREKIIKLAQDLKPALPEEANRRMTRGTLAFKEAKSEADYKDAAAEFQQAALVAPWYADAYYNLGVAQNKANDFGAAARSLKLYLIANPDAPDAKAAQNLLYEMEFRQEKANKEKAEQAAQQAEQQANAQKQAQRKQLVETFSGTWYGKQCFVGAMSMQSLNRGCNQAEHDRVNWHTFWMQGGPTALQFEVQNDGTVKMSSFSSWARCNGDVFGGPPTSTADAFSDSVIRWEVRPKDGPAREIYSRTARDGSFIEISCDRPRNLVRDDGYHFVQWTRKP